MKKILLIEDDMGIVRLLGIHFKPPLYELIESGSGEEAIPMSKTDVDIVVLDLGLPDADGLEICREIRKARPDLPILVLTARSEELDKVLAFEIGADDYVTKPFSIPELQARVKALLRRSQVGTVLIEAPSQIKYRDLAIDRVKRRVAVSGKTVELTPKEFELLLTLASNPGKCFSREDLLKKVWGYSIKGYEHTVTAHINRLRIKLEPQLSEPVYILTAWGFGYSFAE